MKLEDKLELFRLIDYYGAEQVLKSVATKIRKTCFKFKMPKDETERVALGYSSELYLDIKSVDESIEKIKEVK